MTWDDFIKNESEKEYYIKLMEFVNLEYENHKCHPNYEDIFNAYNLTPLDDVKVVILGQDPYINENEAHGLAFSVLTKTLPPSLKNIYKEMEDDLGYKVKKNGDLTYLAYEGVFLLNTILTVRHKEPLSHKKMGWEEFTDNTIKELDKQDRPMVFILWGNDARKKKELLTNPKHLIIESSHPSPLGASKSFFGSHPFSRANDFLQKNNVKPIKWAEKDEEYNLFTI